MAVMAEKNMVVLHGNHWLMADDKQLTKAEWTTDLGQASLHTESWVRKFIHDDRAMETMPFSEALAMLRRSRDERLRANYFSAFEHEIRRLAPDIDFYIKGVGCCAYHFGWEEYRARGLKPVTAAKRFIKAYKLRMGRKLRYKANAKATSK